MKVLGYVVGISIGIVLGAAIGSRLAPTFECPQPACPSYEVVLAVVGEER